MAEVAQTPYGDTALIAVCDGVGGLSAGEVASGTMVGWFMSWFENDYPRYLSAVQGDVGSLFDSVQQAWKQGLLQVNDALLVYGRNHDVQLGTTCTAILLIGGSYLFVHVGDSRVYRFSEGAMNILTIDQTWVAQEVARGNIPPEKARTHPKRNVILQSVGTQKDLQPVFGRGGYETGDAFMVCCDGFRNELFDDELIDAFGGLQKANESEMRTACEGLVGLVLQRGERDNISVVLASCQEGGDYAPVQPDDSATTVLTEEDAPNTVVGDDSATSDLPQFDSAEEAHRAFEGSGE